ncbi:MAG: methyltransferase domain-containing protein [Thauera sp.]|nr:methyltransferase domain-containing protein [Thauera sp.]
MRLLSTFLVAAALGALGISAPATAQTGGSDAYTPSVGQEGKDVVWVPTADVLVARMLDMAELKPEDRLVDLGSGDGRTVIAAARRGVKSRGIEYNPDLVALSQAAARTAGVSDMATFEQGDIFESDFSEATVVTLFLLPALNMRLRPILLDMPPGTRVVSNSFDMEDWQSDEMVEVDGACTTWCRAYKWVVPAKVEGNWKIGNQQLALKQTFQMLEGSMRGNGRTMAIENARLEGARIHFSVGKQHYVGQVDGDTIRGTIDGKTAWSAVRETQAAR